MPSISNLFFNFFFRFPFIWLIYLSKLTLFLSENIFFIKYFLQFIVIRRRVYLISERRWTKTSVSSKWGASTLEIRCLHLFVLWLELNRIPFDNSSNRRLLSIYWKWIMLTLYVHTNGWFLISKSLLFMWAQKLYAIVKMYTFSTY